MGYADHARAVNSSLAERTASRLTEAQQASRQPAVATPVPTPLSSVQSPAPPLQPQVVTMQVPPAPKRRETTRRGVDFEAADWYAIEEAVLTLKKKGLRTGYKVGPSLVVAVALESLLSLYRRDPDEFAHRVRSYVEQNRTNAQSAD
jgi:hypothetical protein